MIHATGDIGQMIGWISEQLELEAGENGCLAVLYKRNDMSGALNSSVWVAHSKKKVESFAEGSHRVREGLHSMSLHKPKLGF